MSRAPSRCPSDDQSSRVQGTSVKTTVPAKPPMIPRGNALKNWPSPIEGSVIGIPPANRDSGSGNRPGVKLGPLLHEPTVADYQRLTRQCVRLCRSKEKSGRGDILDRRELAIDRLPQHHIMNYLL